ncbi:oxidoreductase [Hyaloraphidium curvatum]|nr:oxidoreductase [Hyaloraphidium curvatum]
MAEIRSFPAKTDASVVATGELGSENSGLENTLSIVTGGASGIGVETVRALAVHGSHVVVAARNAEAAGKVVDEVNADCKKAGSKGGAEFRKLDLNSLAAVREFAKDVEPLVKEHGGIDYLILNAGIMALREREETADGFEAQLGTNHVAHQYLTMLLASHVKKGGRIVAVSSIGHMRSGIVWDDPMLKKSYDRWTSYGQSKSANILMAVQLDRLLADRGIHAYSLHPGGIMTGLQKHLKHEEQVAMGWFKEDGVTPRDGFKTTSEGASTTIYAALHKPLDAKGGAYLEDCSVSATKPPERMAAADAERLWKLTEGWIREKGFGGWDEALLKL